MGGDSFMQDLDLQRLEVPFSIDETKKAIWRVASDKPR